MLKQFSSIFFSLILASSFAHAQNSITAPAPEETLIDNKIYFFAHSMCTSCKDAYIYLQTHHKDLNIPITDMKERHHLDLYKQCVKKFNIKNQELRLPLFCMKDNYIMGWQKDSEQKFEEALKNFQTN